MKKAQSSSKTAPKNIAVFLRVRPPVSREKSHTFKNIEYDPADPRAITISRKSGDKSKAKRFMFNKVFQPNSAQKDVYDAYAKNAVDAAFDGQHGVLFVYGQTGSGKTFTISNDDPNNLGVLQQAMTEMWSRIQADNEHDYQCSVSYVQLYNEILSDLLDDSKGRVRIQMGTEGRGDVVLVSEATGMPVEKPVKDYKSTMQMFRQGMSRKEMTSTSMNNTSSRSHTIFTFNINKSTKVKPMAVAEDGTVPVEQGASVALEGRLVLCDLAGSERVSKTHAEGKTLDEAMHINSSLLVLGKVVNALTEKHSQHAPFRESKLTRILQYSLLGNGNTSIVVNVSPSDDNTEETLSAVYFGQRAIQIKQDAKRHEVLDYKALYLQLMAEMDAKNDKTLEDALSEEKAAYEDQIGALQDQVSSLQQENDLLQRENTALKSGMSPEQVATMVATTSSSASASGGKGGAAAGGDWGSITKQLKETIQARDTRIKVISDERMQLAMLLSEEKRTCFRLAQRLQDIMRQFTHGRSELLKRQDELQAELALAKGTDYLSLNAATADPSSPRPPSVGSPSTPGEGQELDTRAQLDQAYQQIAAMRAERVEQIVYQSKAERAIRMLAHEVEAAKKAKK